MAFSEIAQFSPTASARRAVSVTPSDTVAFASGPCRGLLVATAGNYTILLADATSATVLYLAAGVIHPIAAIRVNLTGAASATGIVAFY